MAQSVSNASGDNPLVERSEKIKTSITVEEVRVRERSYTIDVPKINYVEVEYEKPLIKIKEEETLKYIPKNIETIKYVPKELETIKYIPVNVNIEKPIINEVQYEKPVAVEKLYEKPIITEKHITIVNVGDVQQIQELLTLTKELSSQLKSLKLEIQEIKKVKLVEQVISVPRIEWTTVKAERIEWIPVKREMPNAS